MKDLAVVTIISKDNGMLQMLSKQLREAKIDFFVEVVPWPEENMLSFCAAENRITLMEKIVEKLYEYKNIIFIDGWDTLFFGTKEELISKIPKNIVLMSAEKVCYPNVSLMEDIPDGGTPWRYANGGGIAGTPANLIKFFKECKDNFNLMHLGLDQELYNEILALNKNVKFILDHNTQVFYNMIEDEGELINYNYRPLNKETDQLPNFIHFNGKCDSKHFLKEYELHTPKPKISNKVDFIFCLPGNPSSGVQSMNVFGCIIDLMAKGKNVLIRSSQSNNIYLVRNMCLGTKTFEMEQVPFEDVCDDYDKIVWVDSDNIITSYAVLKLAAHDEDIVAAWYTMVPQTTSALSGYTKAACGLIADFERPWTKRPYLSGIIPFVQRNEKGLIPAHYAGMGLMVIKKGVFEKIGFPWFESWRNQFTHQNIQMCELVTDDDGFCHKALDNGFKIWIDPEIRIGHQKNIIA